MSNIEVEARAVLSERQREEMLAFMGGLGVVQTVERVMFDLSGADRERTVVLRVEGGQPTLVAKTGGLAASIRREATVEVGPSTSLQGALGYLEILGYERGMLSLRRVSSVAANGLEYSIRDVLDPKGDRKSTLLEIEAQHVAQGGEEAALHTIEAALGAHGLTPLSRQEWEQWVDHMYKTVDRPFGNTANNVQRIVGELAGFAGIRA